VPAFFNAHLSEESYLMEIFLKNQGKAKGKCSLKKNNNV